MTSGACCAPPTARGATRVRAVATKLRRPSTKRVAHLPGGRFTVGTNDGIGHPDDGEGPARPVRLRPFWIDTAAVSNSEFARFARDTHYATDAEQAGWSYVFQLLLHPDARSSVLGRAQPTPWWLGVRGACWKAPFGPGSGIDAIQNHPVTHVSWNDAAAFAAWAGKRLPTEAEWEYAARGGLDGKRYPWGDELLDRGRHRCNIWQGEFPTHNTARGGFPGTAPVKSFRANGFGLYNMVGNVWEWVAGWWAVDHDPAEQVDPSGPAAGTQRVIRGGSYLCHDSYCNRYRVAARSSNTPDSSLGHLGFRLAMDEPEA